MNETLDYALQIAQIATLLGVGAITPKLFELLVTLLTGKMRRRRTEVEKLHTENDALSDQLRDLTHRLQVAEGVVADYTKLRSRNVRLVNRNRELREGFEHARLLLIRHGIPNEHPYPDIDESTDGL